MCVVIVDGYAAGAFLADELRHQSVEVLHVRSSADPPAFYRHSLDAERFDVDLGYWADSPELVRMLRERKATAVLAATEPGVDLAERLSELLGLPGNEVGTTSARRDKSVMAERLDAAHLEFARSKVVRSVSAAADWYACCSEPVVVKPAASAGTDGVRFCDSIDAVVVAVERILAPRKNFLGRLNQAALIQERLTGLEYYVNTVSDHGEHKVVECWLYQKRASAASSPIYDFVTPVDPAAEAVRTIVDYVKRALTAIGVRNGPAHSEVILTNRGPVLIDVGARLGGGVLPAVVQRFTGVSHASATA
jgi:biotin carboxylase